MCARSIGGYFCFFNGIQNWAVEISLSFSELEFKNKSLKNEKWELKNDISFFVKNGKFVVKKNMCSRDAQQRVR